MTGMFAGSYVGRWELSETDRVRAIRDLKGKTVAIRLQGGAEHIQLASMAGSASLDPRMDIHWVAHPASELIPLLAEGNIDAFLTELPFSLELREKQIGHVIVNS